MNAGGPRTWPVLAHFGRVKLLLVSSIVRTRATGSPPLAWRDLRHQCDGAFIDVDPLRLVGARHRVWATRLCHRDQIPTTEASTARLRLPGW